MEAGNGSLSAPNHSPSQGGRSATVSIQLVNAALWLPMDPARKLVFLTLCDRANSETGACRPGREEISARSSYSLKTVTEHLKALEAEGWFRSQRGNRRLGETTRRWLDVERILREGAAARVQYQRRRWPERGSGEMDTPTPKPTDQAGLSELDAGLGEVHGNDQVKVRPILGEAASPVYVTEPSADPSEDPSCMHASMFASPETGQAWSAAFPMIRLTPSVTQSLGRLETAHPGWMLALIEQARREAQTAPLAYIEQTAKGCAERGQLPKLLRQLPSADDDSARAQFLRRHRNLGVAS